MRKPSHYEALWLARRGEASAEDPPAVADPPPLEEDAEADSDDVKDLTTSGDDDAKDEGGLVDSDKTETKRQRRARERAERKAAADRAG